MTGPTRCPAAAAGSWTPTARRLPGEYVAGWLKRGPTGVIGTNKADAAQTVQALLADLAGGPDVGVEALPRPGLLRMPGDGVAGPDDAPGLSPLPAVLAARGVRAVSYADWLRIEAAEGDLARSLGRGERVKLASLDAIRAALRGSPVMAYRYWPTASGVPPRSSKAFLPPRSA